MNHDGQAPAVGRVKRVPQRSCVACRQTRGKWELLRVVRTPSGEIRVDITGKLAGRGAYLCRQRKCVENALRQGRLTRALAAAIAPEVAEQIRQLVEEEAHPA